MDKLTLRDASERTGLSITTLRRYIRSGRLPAEKAPGRYGPEYCFSAGTLERAGIACGNGADPETRSRAGEAGAPEGFLTGRAVYAPQGQGPPPPSSITESILREMVPIDLYRELSMKHEQLLVQYGMVRVGGQRLMEFKAQAEELAETLHRSEDAARSDRERSGTEIGFLQKHMRQAELEIEQKNQELSEMLEKLRVLELITRNAITTESIEHQFTQVFDKRREIDEMSASSSDERRRKLAALDEVLKTGFRVQPREPIDQ